MKFLIFNIPFFYFPFGLLFPSALVGCWYAFKRHKDISLILLFVISYAFSFITFFVCARFRHPVIPFLIILASFAIISVIDEIRKRRVKNFKTALVIFVGSFIFFNANIYRLKRGDDALNYLTLAEVEYKKENYPKAVVYLRESLDRKPDYAEALNLLGETYQRIGDAQQAMFYFLKALESDPTQPEVYCNIGTIYAGAGKYPQARDYYGEALRLDPYFVRADNNLGNVYFSQGILDTALIYYKKASALDPDYVSPLYHQGLVYKRYGELAKAESVWHEVLRIEPGHIPARRSLEKLRDDRSPP